MVNSLFYIFLGSALLYFGAEWIVKGGISVAKRFGISTLVIGLTVVAFGTSLPELVVSVIAAIEDSSTLAIGNAVGSNIANIGLALALSSLIFPITIKYSPIKRDLWIYLCSCLILFIFVLMTLILSLNFEKSDTWEDKSFKDTCTLPNSSFI